MLFLYRKHGVHLSSFTYLLTHFLSRTKIILDDFSINGFEQNGHLEDIPTDYTLTVKQPTHLLGSLHDHVYIKIISKIIFLLSVS